MERMRIIATAFLLLQAGVLIAQKTVAKPASADPVRPDAIYPIGSASKAFNGLVHIFSPGSLAMGTSR